MATITERIQVARSQGYTDDKVVEFLAQKYPKIRDAFSQGHGLDEIGSYLDKKLSQPAAQPVPAAAPAVEQPVAMETVKPEMPEPAAPVEPEMMPISQGSADPEASGQMVEKWRRGGEQLPKTGPTLSTLATKSAAIGTANVVASEARALGSKLKSAFSPQVEQMKVEKYDPENQEHQKLVGMARERNSELENIRADLTYAAHVKDKELYQDALGRKKEMLAKWAAVPEVDKAVAFYDRNKDTIEKTLPEWERKANEKEREFRAMLGTKGKDQLTRLARSVEKAIPMEKWGKEVGAETEKGLSPKRILKDPAGWFRTAVTQTAQQIPIFVDQMVSTAVGTAIAGPAGGFAAGTASMIGLEAGGFIKSAESENMTKGLTAEQKEKWQEITDKYAFEYGTISGIIEYTGNLFGGVGALASMTSAAKKELIKQVVERVGGVFGEGVEEWSQAKFENFFMKKAVEDMQDLYADFKPQWKPQNTGEAFWTGATVSLLTSGLAGGGKALLSAREAGGEAAGPTAPAAEQPKTPQIKLETLAPVEREAVADVQDAVTTVQNTVTVKPEEMPKPNADTYEAELKQKSDAHAKTVEKRLAAIGSPKDRQDILDRSKRIFDRHMEREIDDDVKGEILEDLKYLDRQTRDGVMLDEEGVGLQGRAAYDATIDEAIKEKPRFGDITVVAIDLQNVGGGNEVLTHEGMNVVFRHAGGVLRAETKAIAQDNTVDRIGGDEIAEAVYAPQADVDAAMDRAAKAMDEYNNTMTVGDILREAKIDVDTYNAKRQAGGMAPIDPAMKLAEIEHPKHQGMKTGVGRIMWGTANTSQDGLNNRNKLLTYADNNSIIMGKQRLAEFAGETHELASDQKHYQRKAAKGDQQKQTESAGIRGAERPADVGKNAGRGSVERGGKGRGAKTAKRDEREVPAVAAAEPAAAPAPVSVEAPQPQPEGPKPSNPADVAPSVQTQPTEPQKEAGNYQKGHVRRDGLDISIENPAGSTRTGTNKAGKSWSSTLKHHYGYIRGTKGPDKDHIDAYIKDVDGGAPEGGPVWIVNQTDEKGNFDEPKVMMGFESKADAEQGYLANYEKGWKNYRGLAEMSMDEFKEWSKSPESSKKQFVKAKEAKAEAPAEIETDQKSSEKRKAKAKERISAVFKRYQDGDNSVSTIRDVVDEIEEDAEIAGDQELYNAISDYQEKTREDAEEYGMRSGLPEESEDAIADMLMARYEKAEPAPAAEPQAETKPKPQASKVPPAARADESTVLEGKGVPKIEVGKVLTPFDTPEILEIRRRAMAIPNTEAIMDTPERIALQKEKADILYGKGAKNKERIIYMVMGPPASGKSTVAANPIAKEIGGIIVDPDDAKRLLPEYENGIGAFAVHSESKRISEMVLTRALESGDNIVLPLVGGDIQKCRDNLARFKKYGYTAHLRLVWVEPEVAVKRAIKRYHDDGRWVEISYIYNEIGLTPVHNYGILMAEGGWRSYEETYTGDRKAAGPGPRQGGEGDAGGLGRQYRSGSGQVDSEAGSGTTEGEEPVTPAPIQPETGVEDERVIQEPTETTLAGVLPEDVRGAGEVGEARKNAGKRGKRRGSTDGADAGGRDDLGRGVRSGERPGTDAAEGGQQPRADEPVRDERVDSRNNYRITESDNLGSGGITAKYDDNVGAIRLLRTIEQENRLATPDEQAKLVRYVGWGSMPQAFDEKNAKWKDKYNELKALLTPDEWQAARASTINAHYTSPKVIQAMWNAVTGMGFNGGVVLEPGMGIGNFFGLRPENMQIGMVGIELDELTGRIARQLYQGANVIINGFQDYQLQPNSMNLAIGNVPFSGTIKPFDKNFREYGMTSSNQLALHDFFFVKSLYGLKPGGVMAFITSRYTMDKQDSSVRQMLAHKANFLGAIRLPNNAFKQNAGTEVVTDIIFMQKRGDDEAVSQLTNDFIGTSMITLKAESGESKEVPVNNYYQSHPEMLLGDQSLAGTMYGSDEYTLVAKEGQFESQLEAALAQLPKGIISHVIETETKQDIEQAQNIIDSQDVAPYAFVSTPAGDVMQNIPGEGMKVRYKSGSKEATKLKGMLRIQGALRTLLQRQAETGPEEELKNERQALNKTYDQFVAKFGPISTPQNVTLLGEDPGSYQLMALEKYNRKEKTAKKVDIFTKRTLAKESVIESAETPEDAYLVTLSQVGSVDFTYMEKLTGIPADEIREKLMQQGIIFQNPRSLKYEPSDEYLSGNVREKLKIAQKAAKKSPEFNPNVEALKAVIPVDVPPEDIYVRLNSPFIGAGYIKSFISQLLDSSEGSVEVTHSSMLGKWTVTPNAYVKWNNNNIEKYGTKDYPATDLVDSLLNNKSIKVTRTEGIGEEKTTYVDQEATDLARQKAEDIKQAFSEWVWKDVNRANDIIRRYNDDFNAIVPREYVHPMVRQKRTDITFPGMNKNIRLRTHQLNVVWRGVVSKCLGMFHQVGSGKTMSMIGIAMERRRLHLSNKPMIVVPNHMVEQWAKAVYKMYPNAKVLVATDKNFEAKKRRVFVNRIATGDWDLIIMKKSNFQMIPMSPAYERRFLKDKIAEYEHELKLQDAGESDSYGWGSRKKKRTPTVKQLEQKIENYEERLKALSDTKKDIGVGNFEGLGVDYLFADEADAYKNLDYSTQMENVAGLGQQSGNKITMDMMMKVRYLQSLNDGGGITFATGTPISNTMAEAYHMMRYLQPERLKEMNLNSFDEWANAYGEAVSQLEQNNTGSGWKLRTRFSKFVNVPELMQLLGDAWDMQTSQMLKDAGILTQGKELPLSEVKTIAAPATPIIKSYIKHLQKREAALQNRRGKPEKGQDNVLVIIGDGRKAAVDMRLINPALPDDPNSKLNIMIRNVKDVYDRKPGKLQTIFYDLTSPDYHGFSVHNHIRERLVEMGIPKNRIAFIHEYDTDAKKQELYDSAREGRLSVLIGSTGKMGAGTNIQPVLADQHHLDAPWRPRDIEQRDGRIIRQGNTNKEVTIWRYVTKGSYDTGLWNILETKAKTISQVMAGKHKAMREIEDALNFTSTKILSIENPLIKESVELQEDVRKLRSLEKSHLTDRIRMMNAIKTLPGSIKTIQTDIAAVRDDIKKRGSKPEEYSIKIGDAEYSKPGEAGKAIVDLYSKTLKELRKSGKSTTKVEGIGSYGGFPLNMQINDFSDRVEGYMVVQGKRNYTSIISDSPVGSAQALTNALYVKPEAVLDGYENKAREIQERLDDMKARVDTPFKQAEELRTKIARDSEIKTALEVAEKQAKNTPEEETAGEEEYNWDFVEKAGKQAEEVTVDASPEENPAEKYYTYRSHRGGADGFDEIENAKPVKVKGGEEFEWFSYKHEHDGMYYVIEVSCGRNVGGGGKTLKEAIAHAEAVIAEAGPEKTRDAIKYNIDKTGLSPRAIAQRDATQEEKEDGLDSDAAADETGTDVTPSASLPAVEVKEQKTITSGAPHSSQAALQQVVRIYKANPNNASAQDRIASVHASHATGEHVSWMPKNGKGDTGYLNMWEKAYTAMKELAYPLTKIDAILQDAGIKQAFAQSMSAAVDQVRGSAGAAKEFMRLHLDPIYADIRGKGDVARELSKYLVAKRTVWLYDNKDGYQDGGYSREEAQSMVESVEKLTHPMANTILNKSRQIWAYPKALVAVKRQAGIIDDGFYEALNEPYYVPFYRDTDKPGRKGISAGRAQFTTTTTGIRRIKGSETGYPIIDPLQSLVGQTYETIVNAARAQVANRIIDLAEAHPEVIGFINKLPPRWRKVGTIEHRTEIDAILRPQIEGVIGSLGGAVVYKTKLGKGPGHAGKELGQYDPNTETLRVLLGATESTAAHELGHQIDDKRTWLRGIVGKHEDEMKAIARSRYEGVEVPVGFAAYVEKPEEMAAEFVALYVTDRGRLAEIAPSAMVEFEQNIERDIQLSTLRTMAPTNVKGLQTLDVDNWVMDNSIPSDEDVFSVRRGGKLVHYRAPKELSSAIRNLRPEQIPLLLRLITIPSKMLRTGAVSLNIDFIVPNLFRDQQDAAFNAGTIPFVDAAIGLKHLLAEDKVYTKYMLRGGAMDHPESGMRGLNLSAQEIVYGTPGRQFLDPVWWENRGLLAGVGDVSAYIASRPFAAIRYLAEISEGASRLGTFHRAKARGMGDIEAVHIARQSTLDFQRIGSRMTVPNNMIPFLNAGIEGIDRVARTIKADPVKAILKAGVMLSVMFGLYSWNRRNRNYKKIPQREKGNNWIIMLGEETAEYLKIPKGHITKLLVNPMQMITEKADGTSTLSGWGMAADMFANASPVDASSVNPVMLKLILEPIANYDFYWRRHIVSPSQKGLPAGYQFDKRTSETLKAIGKGLRISPAMMQHEIITLTGGAGRSVLAATDWVLGTVGAVKPMEINEDRLPVVRRFLGKAEDWKSDIDSDLRTIDKRLTEIRIARGSTSSLIRYYGYTNADVKKAYTAANDEQRKLMTARKELLSAKKATEDLVTKLIDQ